MSADEVRRPTRRGGLDSDERATPDATPGRRTREGLEVVTPLIEPVAMLFGVDRWSIRAPRIVTASATFASFSSRVR